MGPETAKIKAETLAKLKSGLGAGVGERKKHNSEEQQHDGNVAKKLKLSSSDENLTSSSPILGGGGPVAVGGQGGGGGGAKPDERDLNANREIRVMFTNLDKEYVERLKPQLVAIGIEVRVNWLKP